MIKVVNVLCTGCDVRLSKVKRHEALAVLLLCISTMYLATRVLIRYWRWNWTFIVVRHPLLVTMVTHS